MTEPTTLASKANVDSSHAAEVILQTYRQVFGNRHLMELDVNSSLEALFMNGDLTVQGFVTALAQSETYRKLFLEPNSPYKFVELNFKHLLGRPPHDQAELMFHVRLLQDEGFEAEIASYTYSEEYLSTFGFDQVPYNRASQSMVGGRTLNYTRANALEAGYAGYDSARPESKLLKSLCLASSPNILDRKSVGNAGSLTISWTSNRQVGANRRAVQKSVVSQTSMSSTIRTILAQGGKILSIAKA
jgi:phycoerythrin-associated linker protein